MSNDITLTQILKKKKELREQLTQILSEFEERTGCFVEDIDIDRIHIRSKDNENSLSTLCSVEIEVKV